MNDNIKTDEIEQLLDRFYAADEEEAETIAGVLIERIIPRMYSYLKRIGIDEESGKDLCSQSSLDMLRTLRRSRLPGAKRIHNFSGLMSTIVKRNAYDWLRAKHGRRRWNSILEGLLDGKFKGIFARWQAPSVWFCGFKEWRGLSLQETENYQLFRKDPTLFEQKALKDRNPQTLPIPTLLTFLFRWLDTPLEVGDLTDYVKSLHENSQQTLSIEQLMADGEGALDSLLPPDPQNVERIVLSALEGTDMRKELWEQVCALAPRQRTSLLLGLDGEDLIAIAGRLSAAADALDLPLHTLAELLPNLPLKDQEIAERLGDKAVQVSNLRKCARERLARRLQKKNGNK